jgi:hypothetical protein
MDDPDALALASAVGIRSAIIAAERFATPNNTVPTADGATVAAYL